MTKTAVLLIDCQSSFIDGSWAQHFDAGEITALRRAFEKVVGFLRSKPKNVALAMTECPFWARYDRQIWPPIRAVIPQPEAVPLFVKPDNDVNEFADFSRWLEARIGEGTSRLVIGGCTLNSCVRVSAITTSRRFSGRIQVAVDLSLCGARTSNYLRGSVEWTDLSPVEAAIDEMKANGVTVLESTEAWLADAT